MLLLYHIQAHNASSVEIYLGGVLWTKKQLMESTIDGPILYAV